MEERGPALFHQLRCPRVGLCVALAGEDHLGAVAPGIHNFRQRGWVGHDDSGGNLEAPGVIGHSLGVIAGGRGNDAATSLLGRELEHAVEGTTLLE